MVYYLTAEIFATYSLIRKMFYKTSLIYVAIFINILWILIDTVIISIALYSSYTATNFELKTPIIISSIVKRLNWNDSPCLAQVFKTFLLEVQYRNMFFENEFFRIDWKLLFSVS